MQRIKVLFLVADPFTATQADPSTTTQSQFDEKVCAIRDELQQFKNLVFYSEWVTSVEEVKEKIEFHHPRVVHFISSTCRGFILPMQAEGRPAANHALRVHFSSFSLLARLIILDGCYPPDQVKDLAEVFDCVISTNDHSDTSNVLRFIILFYRNLSMGCTIQGAFDDSQPTMVSSLHLELRAKPFMEQMLLPPDKGNMPTVILQETGPMKPIVLPPTIDQRNAPTETAAEPLKIRPVSPYSRFKRQKVFIFYYKSGVDSKWLRELQKCLKPMEDEGYIELDLRDITKISADVEQEEALQTAIETAIVAVLLVSMAFLASSIAKDLLPRLLRQVQPIGTTVIPLILEPCLFKLSPLSAFQPIYPPDISLEQMTRRVHRKETLVKVAEIISEKCSAL